MINGFNARATGSKVAKVGANMEELHGAVCIEMSPFSMQQQQQLEANIKLAAGSKDMIPAPSGKEEFLTLGTSHMCMFIRCAKAGLKSCFKNISAADGSISMEILATDPDFKKMLDEGWDWVVLPWQVEAAWPTLPEFAQRALNASNAVASDATEWEVAVSIGEVFSNMQEPSWELAMASAAASDPPCLSYLSAICTIVREYGGGCQTFL